MYNAKYISSTGYTYDFGVAGSTVFDMDIGDGISVDISTAQGFSQIGDSVTGQSVSGRLITAKGVVYRNISTAKRRMRGAFPPFSTGTLIFDNGYHIDVYVKDTPSFSPVKDDGRFTILLYAPFPLFLKNDGGKVGIGEMIPRFSFPVNYSKSHFFGKKDVARIKDIFNVSDIDVPFDVEFTSTGTVKDITLTNVDTSEFLRIWGELQYGQKLCLERSLDGVLKAYLSDDNGEVDVTNRIDENSTLLKIRKGQNRISAVDDLTSGEALITKFDYGVAVTSIYED